jgi:putative peptidoglycan lipid II flippase
VSRGGLGGIAPPEADTRRAFPPPTGYPAPPGFPQPSFTPAPGYIETPTRQLRDLAPPDPTVVIQRPTGAPAQPNLTRSSKIMALGTLFSRGTGFLRTLVLAAALGTAGIANAYNQANNLPNTIYYLMLGGIFTSVVVPLLVRAAKNDPDKGEGYAERIFSLGVVSLLVVTVIGTALSGPIVELYASSATASQRALMVTWTYFFMPQIFFYGMDSLLGAILNTRGRFGANMWTPAINNVVVIAVTGMFFVTYRQSSSASHIPSGAIHLLGIGTTLGIVIQSICLFPVLRRAGFSMRIRLDFRRSEAREIGRMAGWMVGYVISQWAATVVVQNLANAASNTEATATAGYAAYNYGWSLFQLPYAVVGISVISALLPRMSSHATDRRYSLVREDFSTGVRYASVIVVPAALFLAVLGPPLCEFLFSYGRTSVESARYIGEVFGMFSLGLLPFMFTQLQLRVFYSFQDNRTPAVIGLFMFVVGVVGDVIVFTVLPKGQVVVGLAGIYGVVTLTGALMAWPLLLRKVGSLDGWRVTRSLVRMVVACVPGMIFAYVVMRFFGSLMSQGRLYGLASTVVGGGGALLMYMAFARALGIEEFRTVLRSLTGRLGR